MQPSGRCWKSAAVAAGSSRPASSSASAAKVDFVDPVTQKSPAIRSGSIADTKRPQGAQRSGNPASTASSSRNGSGTSGEGATSEARSSSEQKSKHISINKEILACENSEEILELCDAKLPEFNQVN
eukprot:symbB.v1.2.029289.t1/scaffold3189.1/size61648/1